MTIELLTLIGEWLLLELLESIVRAPALFLAFMGVVGTVALWLLFVGTKVAEEERTDDK